MTIRPCDFFIACECDESPVRNFSAETPDPNTFFRLRFPNPIPPPIGKPPRWYEKESCLGVCFSDVSQEDADACALRDAELCQMPPGIPQPEDPVLYGNAATSCEYPCPEGPPFVYSIPAGTYLALSQELADLTAQSFCANLALEFHTCEMPGPPPAGPCPAIAGTSTTPITLNIGDDTLLEVFFTYTGGNPNDLMFVWFQGNIPVAFTMNAQLALNDVTEADQGDYILGIYSPGCAAVFSSAIRVNVNACPAEVGDPAPDTLDIAMPVEWEQVTASQADMTILVSSDIFSNPTSRSYFTPAYGLDHPPGIYGELYTSGFYDRTAAAFCGGSNVAGGLSIPYLVNEQYNIDSPTPGGFASLNNGVFRTWTGTPPPGSAQFGSYLTACLASFGDVQFDISTAASGTVVTNLPYPPDETSQFKHTNVGGMFTYYFDTGEDTPSPTPIFSPIIFTVLQLDGQIEQPRKLLIDNFASVASMFSNPALAANWLGDFNTRDAYTSTDLRWEAPAIGAFGGAIVSYITNHPTSTNGKGWKIEIYGAGPSIVWRGYKAIGRYAIGTYYKDNSTTPNGPGCLNCSDNSDTDWFPPP